MQPHNLPSFPLIPAREPGTFAVLPLALDLGGLPGTGAGAAWLGERLKNPEVASLIGIPYATVPPLLCELPFGRLEPSLYVAARTLQAWRAAYRPLWLFGDHGLSYGPVRASGLFGKSTTVFVFDAHYDRLQGLLEASGNACGMTDEVHQGNVATWMGRDPHVRKLLQIGIRQKVSPAEIDRIPTEVEVLFADQIRSSPLDSFSWVCAQLREAVDHEDLIILSIDFGVVDPNELPAVDQRVDNGPSLAAVLQLAIPVAQVACSIDVAELNPLRDQQNRGCRTALSLICTLLACAKPGQGQGAWLPVLGVPPRRPLQALGPYTSVIISGSQWLEPSGVEAAILNNVQVDELHATFTESALRTAVANIKTSLMVEQKSYDTITLLTPQTRLQPVGYLGGGEKHVECLTVSHSGKWLASAGWDHTVYVWNLAVPERGPVICRGHDAWVVSAAFSPDDRWLATVSDDRTLRIWPIGQNDGTAMTCQGHDQWVKAVAWSPDGERLVSGSFDGTIAIWDGRRGDRLRYFQAHPDAVWGLSWSPGGEVFASCGERGLLRLWDPDSGKLCLAYEGHIGSVERCRFTSNKLLWSLSRQGNLLLHALENPRPKLRMNCGLDQTLDLWLLERSHRILVAGPCIVRCIRTDLLAAEVDLEGEFPIGAVIGWGHHHAAAGGDGDRLLLYNLPEP